MKPALWDCEVQSPEMHDPFESYVGVVRDKASGRDVLHLPIGYASLPVSDVDLCLGTLSRTIAHFSTSYAKETASGEQRDGFLSRDSGQRLAPGKQAGPAFSRIQSCIELMRRLGDPTLLASVRVSGLASALSEHQISRSLEYATFLDDGTPIFEHMWGQPLRLRRTATNAVGLAAWLALDALAHLFPDIARNALSASLRIEWETLADDFARDFGLEKGDSLFGKAAARTLPTLQRAFETIARTNPAVLADARQLHELIDQYLYFDLMEGGDIRGLEGFHRLWEAACLDHARRKFGDQAIFTCDDTLAGEVDNATKQRWRANSRRVFAHNGIARRPDLVLALGERYRIVDFKYSRAFHRNAVFFERRPRAPDIEELRCDDVDKSAFAQRLKASQDVANMEAYRWLMMQHQLKRAHEQEIDMEFWVPDLLAGTQEVAWFVEIHGRAVPDSSFDLLTVRYLQSREILSAYAGHFQLL